MIQEEKTNQDQYLHYRNMESPTVKTNLILSHDFLPTVRISTFVFLCVRIYISIKYIP